jgi:hypothetical protein
MKSIRKIYSPHDYIRSNNIDNDVLTVRDSTYSSTYGISLSDTDDNLIDRKDDQSAHCYILPSPPSPLSTPLH